MKDNEPSDLIIIGASGGVGQYLIKAFKDQHRIIGTFCDHSDKNLEPGVKYWRLDVNDRSSFEEFASQHLPSLRRPVLIYAAGISPNSLVHNTSDKDWDLTLSTNLTGAMLASRSFLPKMRDVGFGRIIFISSVLSRISVPGTAAYSASKAALCALARVVACENADKGITANTIALGYFDVGIIKSVPKMYLHHKVLPSIPQGRLGHPSNISQAIQFIINADYMTGAVLDINGGLIGV